MSRLTPADQLHIRVAELEDAFNAYSTERDSLRAELATVTAERDALVEAANAVLHTFEGMDTCLDEDDDDPLASIFHTLRNAIPAEKPRGQ